MGVMGAARELYVKGLSDTVLVQQASGTHVPLLRTAMETHAAYAESMSMDYYCYYGRTTDRFNPYWEKIFIVQRLLEKYKTVLYLDADTLIVNPKDNLRSVISRPLMMVRHPGGCYGGVEGHWNTGVMFVQNTDLVKTFLKDVIEHGPGERDWWEQTIVNHILILPWYKKLVGELSCSYNSTYKVNEVPNPVIMALHGPTAGSIEEKVRIMKSWMEK
jgi:hypothetical protein